MVMTGELWTGQTLKHLLVCTFLWEFICQTTRPCQVCGKMKLDVQFFGLLYRYKDSTLSRDIPFDDSSTRCARCETDMLATICDVWNQWVKHLPLMFNPGEGLVPFRGKCVFEQHMPSKLAKYGIKIWAACDARTSYT